MHFFRSWCLYLPETCIGRACRRERIGIEMRSVFVIRVGDGGMMEEIVQLLWLYDRL